MRGLVQSLVLLAVAASVITWPASAQISDYPRKHCPTNHPQSFPFSATDVEVDSVFVPLTRNRSEIINCLQIVRATHEYYVELAGTNLSNVWTRDGGYLAQNDPFVVRSPQYKQTLLYLGPNRDNFSVKILKEPTQLGMVVDSVLTWLVASLPTKRLDPEKNLQSVELRFEALDKGDAVELDALDQTGKGRLSFRLADAATPGIAGLSGQIFSISKDMTRITYRVSTGPKTIRRSRIEFIDSERQLLAAMDLYLLVPAGGPR